MPDATELVKTVKQAAVEAVEACKPVEVCFGTVASTSPLSINVEQKMILGEAQLILSRNVTDYKTKVTINWETGDASHKHGCRGGECDIAEDTHKHTLSGQKEVTFHNSLAKGEKVVLLRQQGGQVYIVWDRVVT